jgi:hypothetical protein
MCLRSRSHRSSSAKINHFRQRHPLRPARPAQDAGTVQHRIWDIDATPWLVHSFEIRTRYLANGFDKLVDRQSLAAAGVVCALAATRSGANAKLRQNPNLKVIPDDAAVAQISIVSPGNILRRNVKIMLGRRNAPAVVQMDLKRG